MALIQCPGCGSSISEKAVSCPKCGKVLNAAGHETHEDNVDLESCINKFNWGAAGLWPIWGFANGMWWLILISMAFIFVPASFIVVAHVAASLYMGFNGGRLAQKYKKWDNPVHFKRVQDSWEMVGLVFFVLNIISLIYMNYDAIFRNVYY